LKILHRILALNDTSIPIILNDLYDNTVILILFQPTNNDDGHNTLYTLYAYRHSSAMNSILTSTLAQPVFLSESLLVPFEFVMHVPRASSPSQHSFPFACHPDIIVGLYTGMCTGVEEKLVRICQGYVYNYGGREWKEAFSKRTAQRPCIGDCEGLKYEGRVNAGN